MKVKAEHLLPLILDFAEQYLQDNDFQHLKSSLKPLDKDHVISDYKNNYLVKKGGLTKMLEFYFENNKKIYKKFKKSISEESDQQVGKKRSDKEKRKNDDSDSEQEENKKNKKRQRANSNSSIKSQLSKSSGKSDQKNKNKKKDGKRSRGESLDWQPPVQQIKPVHEIKPVKFQRIDESKFVNLMENEADYSYEAKKKFGQTGDTYGDWSNQQLKDKVGKKFIKEKNKMKNKNFHSTGGRFNASAVNSVLM